MNVFHVPEPELRFGVGSHVDARFGIMNCGVLDYGDETAPRRIVTGIVGTAESIDTLVRWIERCSQGLCAKESKQPHLFPRFPGFNTSSAFYSEVYAEQRHTTIVSASDLVALDRAVRIEDYVWQAAELFASRVKELAEDPKIDVVLCAPPMGMVEKTVNEAYGRGMPNFHHIIKAKAMGCKTPTQLVLPMTYDPTKKMLRKRAETERRLQDEATRAWNFFTALYYKAGGIPWRLPHDPADLATCYVGIAFYEALDAETLETSVAQVFNERGEGVIVRGGAASVSKGDRRPFLEAEAARQLLVKAIERYRQIHKTQPARVVVHKSSPFKLSEESGFAAALDEKGIEVYDFVSIGTSGTRLFRRGEYPPLRGTCLDAGDEATLYTRGGVQFYATYPGTYIPRPLLLRRHTSQSSIRSIAEETLALTKLNWNNTQFDGADPITILAARKVGDILKYLAEGEEPAPHYRSYM